MGLLFAISVASFCTVLWLALALARRIRRDQLGRRLPALKPAAMEFFEAGEFRTPRALRLNQDVAPGGARRNPDDTAAPPDQPRTAVHQAPPLREILPMPQPLANTTQREAVIINSKLHFVMAKPVAPTGPMPNRMPQHNISPEISGERKSPQSVRPGAFRRVDLSHYNKDMGDLTDPYTHSPRVSRNRPSVAKNA